MSLNQKLSNCLSLSNKTEVFPAETVAIHHCVRKILRQEARHKSIAILTHNHALIKAVDAIIVVKVMRRRKPCPKKGVHQTYTIKGNHKKEGSQNLLNADKVSYCWDRLRINICPNSQNKSQKTVKLLIILPTGHWRLNKHMGNLQTAEETLQSAQGATLAEAKICWRTVPRLG